MIAVDPVEHRREICRRYYARHRDRLCEERRRRNAEQPEKVTERNRKYYAANADQINTLRRGKERSVTTMPATNTKTCTTRWTSAMTSRFHYLANHGLQLAEIAREMGMTRPALAGRVAIRPQLKSIWELARTARKERTITLAKERRRERDRKLADAEREAEETEYGPIKPEVLALAARAAAARQRREDLRAYYGQAAQKGV